MDTTKLNECSKYKYPIEITFIPENEGGGVAARIPYLGRDSFVGDGDSVEEALANLERLKRDLFEDYIKRGIEIPPPPKDEDYSGKFVVRVPKILHQQLVENARANDISLNTLCVSLLSKNIGEMSLEKTLKKVCNDIQEIKSTVLNYEYTDTQQKEIARPASYFKDWRRQSA
jgi:predicted HicB family RNase H-like nuclease